MASSTLYINTGTHVMFRCFEPESAKKSVALAGALGVARVGGAAVCTRLAVDARPQRQPVVSDDAAVSAEEPRRLGGGFRGDRGGAERAAWKRIGDRRR